ncbi:hypothetical protein Droror1_Dr00027117 [Drosera rotundifolia]
MGVLNLNCLVRVKLEKYNATSPPAFVPLPNMPSPVGAFRDGGGEDAAESVEEDCTLAAVDGVKGGVEDGSEEAKGDGGVG